MFQYKQRYPRRKIVFYGDDTWIKLFPHSIFDRHQGLQSFFVTDFKEIDFNVTMSINEELKRMSDWHLLIVHYLGLDHIGHAIGAFNSLVEEKLSEMDEVIERIYSKMSSNDLLIVTGDHGMADKGGHGGSSYVETHVPAVFVSKQFERSQSFEREYLQIDLTATLSGLLGIPIPFNNLGILIEDLLKEFYHSNRSHLLKCLIDDNRRQLFNLLSSQKLSNSFDDVEFIRDQAMKLANQQDLSMLVSSIVIFSLSTIILYFQFQIERESMFSICLSILIYFLSKQILLSLSFGVISCCLITIFKRKSSPSNETSTQVNFLLKFYPTFHLLSLFSSSFIEEEHQTWYFLFSTYLFISTIEQKSMNNFILLILSRLIRNWNQTGNKWLHLTDIADFFNENQNEIYLFSLHLISTVILICLLNKPRRRYLIFALIVLFYRWNSSWLASLSPLVYYLLLIVFSWKKALSIEESLFLLLYLIIRPHNCLLIVVYMIFNRYLQIDNARLAFLLSQCAFFHLVRIEVFSLILNKILFFFLFKGKFKFICNNRCFCRICWNSIL